ncbi:hypothetical protein [Endozoicomonas lisbonensis]|uniref:DUF955 domain-containing protein n=1 Tax=Endozoicomonas lisbonensis TaxID=3120522 RepID=A0ABV2SP68_9GAMM
MTDLAVVDPAASGFILDRATKAKTQLKGVKSLDELKAVFWRLLDDPAGETYGRGRDLFKIMDSNAKPFERITAAGEFTSLVEKLKTMYPEMPEHDLIERLSGASAERYKSLTKELYEYQVGQTCDVSRSCYTRFLNSVKPVSKPLAELAEAAQSDALAGDNTIGFAGGYTVSKAKELIDQIHDQSPVTDKEAKEFVRKIKFSSSVVGKLKRAGYPVAEVRKDLAELYKLMQGRVPLFNMDTEGKARSYARHYTVFPGTAFNKEILFHEVGHIIERGNDAILRASHHYRDTKAESPKPVSLRELTGSGFYDTDEVALPDHYIHPYVGKVYKHQASEVLSMGLQYFANPEDLAKLAVSDPQFVALVTGVILGVTDEDKARLERENREYSKRQAFYSELNELAKTVKWQEERVPVDINGGKYWQYFTYIEGRKEFGYAMVKFNKERKRIGRLIDHENGEYIDRGPTGRHLTEEEARQSVLLNNMGKDPAVIAKGSLPEWYQAGLLSG